MAHCKIREAAMSVPVKCRSMKRGVEGGPVHYPQQHPALTWGQKYCQTALQQELYTVARVDKAALKNKKPNQY